MVDNQEVFANKVTAWVYSVKLLYASICVYIVDWDLNVKYV